MGILERHQEKWHISGECWLWHRHHKRGYGIVQHEYKARIVTRLVCEEKYGPPPTDQYQASHTCHNPACVNPDHLLWETAIENMARSPHNKKSAGGRSHRGKGKGYRNLGKGSKPWMVYFLARDEGTICFATEEEAILHADKIRNKYVNTR